MISSPTAEEKSAMLSKLRKNTKNAQLQEQEKSSFLEQILNKKTGGDNILYYQVKWKSSEKPCWEPVDKLQGFSSLLEKYDKSHEKASKKDAKPGKALKPKPIIREVPNKVDVCEGKFELGDQAKEILLAKSMFNEITKEKEIFCLVEWHTRSNGLTPLCSFISTKEIRLHDPVLLINFYEKRVVLEPIPVTLSRTEELYKEFFNLK